MDPKTIPVGLSEEVSGGSAPANLPGVYSHPEVEQKILAQNGPQADGAVRLGFAWERNIREEDIYVPELGAPVQTAVLDDSKEARQAAQNLRDESAKTQETSRKAIVQGVQNEAAKLRGGGGHNGRVGDSSTQPAVTGSAEDLERAATLRREAAESEEKAAKTSKKAQASKEGDSKPASTSKTNTPKSE